MATITKRGESFVLTWSEPNEAGRPKQHRRSLGSVSQNEADAVLAIKIAELAAGTRFFDEGPDADLTFAQFAVDYIDWHKFEYPDSTARTAQIIDHHLAPTFGPWPMQEITPRQVERWKRQRRRAGAKPGTITKELRTLKAVLNRAVAWHEITGHLVGEVKPPQDLDDKPHPFFTPDQLHVIYDIDPIYRHHWQFIANTGLRRAEYMAARREHIANDQLMILSDTQCRTKSKRWRRVPLSPGALVALDNLGDDYLAPRMNPRSLSRAFERAARRAGVGGSIHWLRHTFISHLVMTGVDLRTVQELAGHASFQTTLGYAHLADQHLTKAVSGLKL